MNDKLREEVFHMHAQFCSALSEPSRILILYTLAEQPINVTDLAHKLDLPQPSVSRHLKILRERNMVNSRREGQSVIYSIADMRILEALDMLRAVMAAQLKTHAAVAISANQNIQSFS